jgi:hypothetical protein
MSALSCGCDPEALWICAEHTAAPELCAVDFLRADGSRVRQSFRKHEARERIEWAIGRGTCDVVTLGDGRVLFMCDVALVAGLPLNVRAIQECLSRLQRVPGRGGVSVIAGDVAIVREGDL